MNFEKELVTAMSGIVGIQKFLVGLPDRETVGQQIMKSANFQAFRDNKSDLFRLETKTAITSSGAINDPLVPSMKPPIDPGVRRALSVRDLLVEFPTGEAAIELPIKTAVTNNAGAQVGGSPEQRENVSLGQSSYTFENSFLPVQTYGHHVTTSKQVYADAGAFDAFIQGEMRHGLGLSIQDGLLNGTGTTGTLTGLIAGASAYVSSSSPNYTNEIDILRDAIRQVEVADFSPTAIVLNPADWFQVDIRKVGSSNDGYVVGVPRGLAERKIWGLPVVVTNSIAAGTFLTGDFERAGALFVRQGATVEIGRHDANNFTKNLVTVRAEERLAWVTTNSAAMVTGSL